MRSPAQIKSQWKVTLNSISLLNLALDSLSLSKLHYQPLQVGSFFQIPYRTELYRIMKFYQTESEFLHKKLNDILRLA